jgi:hypothetical protein
MVEERGDFCRPHVSRMTLAVEEDVAAAPMDVGLFRTMAELSTAAENRDLLKQAWWVRTP